MTVRNNFDKKLTILGEILKNKRLDLSLEKNLENIF